ncbi:hypothetical protein C8R43DRAFT_991352 [Mycena crocata]|nr:hypothetical protein C8R43DRAFT_991352 [Mycena crocata]
MVESVSEESAVYLVRVVAFATSSKNSVPFQEALLYHGIVGTVTRASRGWAKIQDKLVAECIFPLVLEYLGWQFHGLWAYRYLREAIRGGLLHVIIACIPISVCEEFLAEIFDMLTPHTVYHSVLSCLEPVVDEIAKMQVSPAFEQSPIFPKWCAFWNLTQERMKVKKCYDSQSYVSSKACDNVFCGRMHRRRDLLRCAGCRGPYYCSKDC